MFGGRLVSRRRILDCLREVYGQRDLRDIRREVKREIFENSVELPFDLYYVGKRGVERLGIVGRFVQAAMAEADRASKIVSYSPMFSS